MKKFFITVLSVLALTVAAQAQPRALGVNLGYSTNLSYEHNAGSEDFFEWNLGTMGFDNLQISGVYNFMIAQPSWTSRGEWGFYAGPGLALGTGFSKGNIFMLDFLGQIGLEYTFWFPLQLSIDLCPQFGFYVQKGDVEYHKDGLFGFTPTLSVRYRF